MPPSTPIWDPIAAVFAHQGGWDEALLIILPLVALAGLLVVANRRADRRLAQVPDHQSERTDENPGAGAGAATGETHAEL